MVSNLQYLITSFGFHDSVIFSLIPYFFTAPVAQWVKHWHTDLAVPSSSPAVGEICSTLNRVPLNTAFHYHLSIILI